MSREDWTVFEEIKLERKKKRGDRRAAFQKLWDEGKLKGWVRYNDTHYSCIVRGVKLEYWPGPMRWRYNNRNHTGDVFGFIRGKMEASNGD